jgi:hypothetical protein
VEAQPLADWIKEIDMVSERDVLRIMKRAPGGMGPEQLHYLHGVPMRDAIRVMNRMRDKGLIIRDPNMRVHWNQANPVIDILSYPPFSIKKADGKIAVKALLEIARKNPGATPAVWKREIQARPASDFGRGFYSPGPESDLVRNAGHLPELLGTVGSDGPSAKERAYDGYNEIWSTLKSLGFRAQERYRPRMLFDSEGVSAAVDIGEGFRLNMEFAVGMVGRDRSEGDWAIGGERNWMWVSWSGPEGNPGEPLRAWAMGKQSPSFDPYKDGPRFSSESPDVSGENQDVRGWISEMKSIHSEARKLVPRFAKNREEGL